MSLLPSLPERTNIYLNSHNGISSISNPGETEIIIPSGLITVNEDEHFYINIIQFNTFNSFYNVIDGYNNNFQILKDGVVIISGIIPDGNINVIIINKYLSNLLKDLFIVSYNSLKSLFYLKIFQDLIYH
mmetsp:Transcript_71734/g.191395  ORF Transcript_71734/g.191395 Transcript_71734/m.191395 type:complete len:130 (-) Transcript_71734:39-428(-)